MNLQRRLARLGSIGGGTRPQPAPTDDPSPPSPASPASPATPDAAPDAARTDAPPAASAAAPAPPAPDPHPDPARAARIAEIRARLHAMTARRAPGAPPASPAAPAAASPADAAASLDDLAFTRDADAPDAPVWIRARDYGPAARHGDVPLHAALRARGDAIATLALDPALAAFDASRALYLDTETTGLSGGTGTLAFLVGLAYFAGDGALRVEQYFLAELCDEPAMLARVAARVEAASAIVTYNGKAFDLPLLRARFVMSRMRPPREPPHLDLLHVARRIYGARVDACRLTTLERDALGFVRAGDVPSSEIPARYTHYLRTRDASGIAPVVAHNAWDVLAMAALAGELAARVAGAEAAGRFEPADMTGLARTALRAGREALATALASDAAALGAKLGHRAVAARAGALAAKLHRRRGDHGATRRALLDALAQSPDDARVHLALAKLYEHQLRDPARALEHCVRADGAEDPGEHARRLARLRERAARAPLRLPGIE